MGLETDLGIHGDPGTVPYRYPVPIICKKLVTLVVME